jgi:hypothetical protein
MRLINRNSPHRKSSNDVSRAEPAATRTPALKMNESAALKGHGFSRAANASLSRRALEAAEKLDSRRKIIPQRLKPAFIYAIYAAQLKSCPFKTKTQESFSAACLAPEGMCIPENPSLQKPITKLALACLAALVMVPFIAIAQNPSPTPAPAALPDAPPAQIQPQKQAPLFRMPAQTQIPPRSKAPITLLEDTLIPVMTNEAVNSKRVKDGAPMLFTVSDDVVVGDALAIPRGATVHGVVIKSKKAGMLTGSPELTFKLVSLDLGGRTYPLYTYQFEVKGLSKTRPTEKKAVRGAYVGAIVGAFAGSEKGGTTDAGRAVNMSAGAAVGAGVGTMVSAATPGPEIWIPSEAQVDFYLASPITVTPVSAQEAARLAQGLTVGGPSLYVRGDTP